MDDVILNRIDMKLLSIPENVAVARLAVAMAAAGGNMTMSALEEIKVAVSEAVSNSVIHGYGGHSDGMIELSYRQYADYIEIVVTDHGCGIADIKQAMQPTFSTVAQRMGLGFAFMNSFTDRLEVKSAPGEGTCVTMIKRLFSIEEAEDDVSHAGFKIRA